jgi:hypothetical protein
VEGYLWWLKTYCFFTAPTPFERHSCFEEGSP